MESGSDSRVCRVLHHSLCTGKIRKEELSPSTKKKQLTAVFPADDTHPPTHSNGLNMRAEYRQHIGGLYLHCIVNVILLYLLLRNVL